MSQINRRQLLTALTAAWTATISVGALMAFGAGRTSAAEEKRLVNVDSSGVAIRGYDPVAFFTTGRPTAGKASFSAVHDGATYRFASAENRDAFQKSPAKYAPQYGGYCAYGVAKDGLFDVDPATGQIVGGKLYLNLSKNIHKIFNKDVKGYIRQADTNWPDLVRSQGK